MVSEFFALASAFAPPAAPPATPPPAVVVVAPPLPCPCAGKGSCSAAPPIVAVPPAPPRLWQMKDAGGQMWTHADKGQLESFVAARDSSMRPAYYPFTVPAAPSACGPRGCR